MDNIGYKNKMQVNVMAIKMHGLEDLVSNINIILMHENWSVVWLSGIIDLTIA